MIRNERNSEENEELEQGFFGDVKSENVGALEYFVSVHFLCNKLGSLVN
jgi:hypothetical protein